MVTMNGTRLWRIVCLVSMKKKRNGDVDDIGQRSKWLFMIMQSLWFGEYDFLLS